MDQQSSSSTNDTSLLAEAIDRELIRQTPRFNSGGLVRYSGKCWHRRHKTDALTWDHRHTPIHVTDIVGTGPSLARLACVRGGMIKVEAQSQKIP